MIDGEASGSLESITAQATGGAVMNPNNRKRGFMLIEMLIVIAVLAALMSIAVPSYVAYTEIARAAACLSNRHNIEQDKRTSDLNNEAQSLVIDNRYKCPSGGIYAWLVSNQTQPGYPSVACSLHYATIHTPLTSLGSTFTEITSAMISLINNFYQKNNRYPRSWGDYVFTDIGLNATEWAQPVNGLYYKPGGTTVKIRPADGYAVTMKSLQGTNLILTSKLSWDVIYDMATTQWYYHTVTPSNAIDIKTMQVIKN